MGLKGLFFKESETDSEVEAKEKVTEEVELENGEKAEFNFSFTEAGVQGAPEEGVFNKEIYDHLQGVLVSSVPDKGLESFSAALDNLSAVNIPDSAKFQTAFITLQTSQGLTQESLLSAINSYISKLDSEKVTFQSAADSKRNSQVGSREQEKEANTSSIEVKSAQIQKLTEEIQELSARNKELDSEIITEGDNITSSVTNFIATADTLRQELEEDKANIEKYLSTTKENA